MPDPLPGPSQVRTATAPEAIAGTPGKGVRIKTLSALDVTPKLSASDTFTNLDNFVTVYGEPAITSGMLTGEGVVRYKNQALTDSHKVSAVIGDNNTGTARLVICGNEAMTRFYALEVGNGEFAIIKGNAASSVETGTGLIAILFSLLFGLFSLFSKETTRFAETSVSVTDTDEVAIWYDAPNHTLRTYKNDVATACTLEVPRGEIPHGPGNRWCGVATELDVFLFITQVGPRFTSITIEDV